MYIFFVSAYKFIVPWRVLFNISTSYNLQQHITTRRCKATLYAKIDIAASSLILICIMNIINTELKNKTYRQEAGIAPATFALAAGL